MKETVTLWRLMLGALGMAVAFYVCAFWLDHHLRTRRGPWEVTFGSTAEGEPMLRIHQPHLGVKSAQVIFGGERSTQAPVVVRFDRPPGDTPFGRVKHHDLTYLPGVVTLEVFGHELELLPRTLYANRKPVAWAAATNLTLRASDHPAVWSDPKSKPTGSTPK